MTASLCLSWIQKKNHSLHKSKATRNWLGLSRGRPGCTCGNTTALLNSPTKAGKAHESVLCYFKASIALILKNRWDRLSAGRLSGEATCRLVLNQVITRINCSSGSVSSLAMKQGAVGSRSWLSDEAVDLLLVHLLPAARVVHLDTHKPRTH